MLTCASAVSVNEREPTEGLAQNLREQGLTPREATTTRPGGWVLVGEAWFTDDPDTRWHVWYQAGSQHVGLHAPVSWAPLRIVKKVRAAPGSRVASRDCGADAPCVKPVGASPRMPGISISEPSAGNPLLPA